jgi:hypothetical protein
MFSNISSPSTLFLRKTVEGGATKWTGAKIHEIAH